MAPCAAVALAMPQASERLLATPMIRPRLPCIRVPDGISTPAAVQSFPRLFGELCGARAASYTNGLAGPAGLRPARPCPAAAASCSASAWLRREPKCCVDGSGIDRPHGAAQGAPLGRDDHDIVAAVDLALMPLHQALAPAAGRPGGTRCIARSACGSARPTAGSCPWGCDRSRAAHDTSRAAGSPRSSGAPRPCPPAPFRCARGSDQASMTAGDSLVAMASRTIAENACSCMQRPTYATALYADAFDSRFNRTRRHP